MSLRRDVLFGPTPTLSLTDDLTMPESDLLRNAQDAVAALAAAYWPTPGYASIVVPMPEGIPSVVIPVLLPSASPPPEPSFASRSAV